MGIFSSLCFIGSVLFLQSMMTLANSISNSGQYNLLSLLCIILVDQLLLRPGLGLVLFATLKALLHYEKIDFENNLFLT